MNPILYFLNGFNILCACNKNHEINYNTNTGKFPDSSCIILKLNKKICSVPVNKINESQFEIAPPCWYWVNVPSLLNIL